MSLQLRQYQQEDVDFAKDLEGIGLFNEQRTGKTPTALKIIQAKGITKFVIVAPKSTLYKWAEEVQAWIPGTETFIVKGIAKRRENIVKEWQYKGGALILNYALCRDRHKKQDGVTFIIDGLYSNILKANPQGIIIDEAHRLQGRTTITAQAVFKMKKIPNRIAITGTPSPDKIEQVWAILHFLYPSIFTSYWKWIEEHFHTAPSYFNPRARDVLGLKLGHDKIIKTELDKFCTNRKRKDVMKWLPPQPIPERIKLPLTRLQKKIINELIEFFEYKDIITRGVLDQLMRVRQVCNTPELLNISGKSPKIEWIKQYIKDYPDTPTLFFTRFSKFARMLENIMPVFDGSVDAEGRAKLIQDFQSGEQNFMVCQIDAAKEGITLDRANTTVFLDMYPPAADNLQARDRFIPVTENSIQGEKHIIYLMMKDSYDEQLYNLVEENADMIDVINNFKAYSQKGRK